VYHCAALVSGRSLKKLRSVNVEGTRTVFEASLETGVRRVIYLSTIAVANGNPQIPLTEDLPLKTRSLYGLSKAEAEEVAAAYRKKGLKIAILRPCMVYGEGEPHALSRLAGGVKRRLIPVLGTGDTKLHLVSVENVVDVLALCLSKEEACEGAYFVADNEVLSVREVLDCIADALNAKKPVVLPGYIAVILARIPCIGDRVSFFLRDRVYSIERLKRILGYVPRVSVYDGLKRAVIACRV
jgi:nucleoside-diphosphate-sugar epimerase